MVKGVIVDINGEGEVSGPCVMASHEHHEELSSGSDVMGNLRWWIRAIVSVSCKGKAMRMIRLRRELGVNSDVMAKGDCAIQFQDYRGKGDIHTDGGVSGQRSY
ncbi:Protein Tanc1 [Manis pentadactyla]|nr:Protein Tanc1 [Manis pentadactyla]